MSTINFIQSLRKPFVLVLGLFLSVSVFGICFLNKPLPVSHHPNSLFSSFASNGIGAIETVNRLHQKAIEVRDYVTSQAYNTEYCFLIDMRIPSGKNRFFVYNLKDDAIEISGLVAHGKGPGNGSDALMFSNELNSNCTSLGRYKLGKSYSGMFGLSYKLHGLDKTNSNAFERSVVLHSFCGVPNKEVFPASICKSEGCPTVAPAFLTQLKVYLDNSDKPILLWIYY